MRKKNSRRRRSNTPHLFLEDLISFTTTTALKHRLPGEVVFKIGKKKKNLQTQKGLRPAPFRTTRSKTTALSGDTINSRSMQIKILHMTLTPIRTMTISGVVLAEANLPTEVGAEGTANAITDHAVAGEQDAAVIIATTP